ncbi:MAG TPA: CaiB/BaiF CoA-transferase family protein [Iamia sp.]|nr:CaiB/BaiF CoA-transferase family protein [Iamia sp.]
MTRREGPLAGIQVVELAGMGPGPFCGMVLADLGAEVIRVERPGAAAPPADILARGRRTVALDLKAPGAADAVLDLVAGADALFEGFRPGVAERLGVGPDACLARNPRLVYGRMTGYGQDGPLAQAAGHDINYIALAGALDAIGTAGGPPVPPLNLVGDFGGGGMLLAVGLLAALLQARAPGEGRVVDVAMVDGTATLMAMQLSLRAQGLLDDARGTNILDGGAPFYRTYGTADDRHVAVGAIEPQFYAALLDGLGLDPATLPDQYDRAGWPVIEAALAAAFATRTRDDWEAHFAGRDACVSPVLTLAEAPEHPHLRHRATYVPGDHGPEPAPAPRFAAAGASLVAS